MAWKLLVCTSHGYSRIKRLLLLLPLLLLNALGHCLLPLLLLVESWRLELLPLFVELLRELLLLVKPLVEPLLLLLLLLLELSLSPIRDPQLRRPVVSSALVRTRL